MSSPDIMGILLVFVEPLLLRWWWHIGKSCDDLVFLPECGAMHEGVGTLLLWVGPSSGSGISYSSP